MVRMTLVGCSQLRQWLTANGCFVVYLCLFCKILLEHTCLSKIALYFCVARENLRPRHAVNFSMPCSWRGVKKFCVGNALRAVQCHGWLRQYDGWLQIYILCFSISLRVFIGVCCDPFLFFSADRFRMILFLKVQKWTQNRCFVIRFAWLAAYTKMAYL